MPLISPSRLEQSMLATLWRDRRGVISYQSALELYEISDVSPVKIHIAVPTGYRTHREIRRSHPRTAHGRLASNEFR